MGGETCTELATGRWEVGGEAFGMGMNTTLTMNLADCSFAFSEWGMAMDDVPSRGVLDGDRVQLDGANHYWRSCEGEVDDAGLVAGLCADDGADFHLSPL